MRKSDAPIRCTLLVLQDCVLPAALLCTIRKLLSQCEEPSPKLVELQRSLIGSAQHRLGELCVPRPSQAQSPWWLWYKDGDAAWSREGAPVRAVMPGMLGLWKRKQWYPWTSQCTLADAGGHGRGTATWRGGLDSFVSRYEESPENAQKYQMAAGHFQGSCIRRWGDEPGRSEIDLISGRKSLQRRCSSCLEFVSNELTPVCWRGLFSQRSWLQLLVVVSLQYFPCFPLDTTGWHSFFFLTS